MGDGNNNNNNNRGNNHGHHNNNNSSNRPEWLKKYDLIGKIGEGTYGLVFLAKIKDNRTKSIAIKKFKQSKDGDGVSPTAIREIMVLFFSSSSLLSLFFLSFIFSYYYCQFEELGIY